MNVHVCCKCGLDIHDGEEMHPVIKPFHVPCHEHRECYVFCIDRHSDYKAWYLDRFGRYPVQRRREVTVQT